jgi:hypothetical protein
MESETSENQAARSGEITLLEEVFEREGLLPGKQSVIRSLKNPLICAASVLLGVGAGIFTVLGVRFSLSILF